jgi:LysR family glycine cleavage system transcriptional activator
MNRKMPLNALRAFEAAGRNLSFTRAAEELFVTPAAVSQQVKMLENYLGLRLLRRNGRHLELTDAGLECLPEVNAGFDRLSASMERLARREADDFLTVSMSPCLGTLWMSPRLTRFQLTYPNIDIRVLAVINKYANGKYTSDVAIRYLPGPFPGCHVDPLMPEHVFPVCSPALLEKGPPLRTPDDLRHHRLLHDEGMRTVPGFPDWQAWLEFARVRGIDLQRGPRHSISSLVVQAALRGEGVALARSVLVADDIAAGRLVPLFDVQYPEVFHYYLVTATGGANHDKIRTFRSWIMGEAQSAWRSSVLHFVQAAVASGFPNQKIRPINDTRQSR